MNEEPDPALNTLTNATIGAAIEVHNILGPGFLESTYEEALSVELRLRGVPHRRQMAVSVDYKAHRVGRGRVDLLVGGEIVVELKSVEAIARIHQAQVISYLKALDRRLGLIINFNARSLRNGLMRIVNS